MTMLRPRVACYPLIATLFIILAPGSFAAESIKLSSPNGALQLIFWPEHDRIDYALELKGKPVLERGSLGILLDGTDLTRGVAVTAKDSSLVSSQYPFRGIHGQATNRYKSITLSLKGGTNPECLIEARAFDDGAAFRHIIPGQNQSRIPDESTTFLLPAGSTVWHHDLGGHYEDTYSKSRAEEIRKDDWLAPPVTFKTPDNLYASISEAALFNYSGMALQSAGDRKLILGLGHKHPISYPYRLRYSNDVDRVSKPFSVNGTITSPWRVIIVANDLHALVNSDIVPNLCPPPDPKLFSQQDQWVRPGRAIWKYLDGGANTFEHMKEFAHWAGELGFEYNVLENFWSRWSDDQIRDLVNYSRERGVGLWFWRHSRELRTAETQEAFFKRLSDLGVVGAKIDFFDHEHGEVTGLYAQLLERAAKYKIMVNFHGSNKPTGESRTWPNELIREGVRGMESSRLQERALHNTTLPFTRYLAGPGDYTPVHFGARKGDTTWAHQVATAAIFNEPLLTYGAHPTNLLQNPALPMIKSIPSVWDETRVLPPSEIGETVVFARRKGKDWFLAILNGPQPRELSIPFAFLGSSQYAALEVTDDGDNPASLRLASSRKSAGDSLKTKLNPGGGYIARFTPEEKPRVYLMDTEHLARVKEDLANGNSLFAAAFGKLKKEADNAMHSGPFTVVDEHVPPGGHKNDYMSQAPYFWPNPNTPTGLPYIRKDGERNPEINKYPDHRLMDSMVDAVETLALASYLTQDAQYARKAAELLRTWFLDPETRMNPHLQFAQAIPGVNTGRGIGLIETRGLTRIVDAAGLLENSSALTQADRRGLHQWFDQFLAWMLESKHGQDEAAAKNNHGTYYDIQIASFALFVGKENLARETLRNVGPKRIATQIEPDGKQPLELARTTSWGYSGGNLTGLFTLARLAEKLDIDLWRFQTPDGRTLAKALDFMMPHALGEAPWNYQQIRPASAQSIHALIRLASLKYPDEKYKTAAAKIPPIPSDSRSLLTQSHTPQFLASSPDTLRVFVVTGGHGFDRDPFYKMFQEFPGMEISTAEHGRGTANIYDRLNLTEFDVVVLYDMPKTITDSQKANFLKLFDKGTGLVVLHHALVSYQKWDQYAHIIGGRYPEQEGREGKISDEVGYEHDVEIPIRILKPNHPITAGLADWTLHDEIYWGFHLSADAVPILGTDHPKSGRILAWTRQEKNSRVVYIQPGHGPQAFHDANYRKLLAQSIAWAARKE